ncbi:MAG: quinolinate synthase NadA [Actinomycetota bacterium]|nr:quinolinate synthase NadA [Actinomycetota bacterium]
MIRLQRPLPERYTGAAPDELAEMIADARAELGARLIVLGHHYQRDDIMCWADARGDSFGLSRIAADQGEAEYVVFCGVHFMAESADILTGPHQHVLLPDLNAGCSMADMADVEAVEDAWAELAEVTDVDRIVPITYMNSSAALKAFVGRHGGSVCTSSNARAVLTWALGDQGSGRPRGDKVLFVPDQHLGRNTGFQLGYRAEEMVVWDPRQVLGGCEEKDIKEARLLLWRGHCSVHQRFRPEHVESFRREHPEGIVIVHPECAHEVVEVADEVGSTDAIIRAVAAAPSGSVIGVGTEIHLVNRLDHESPDKTVLCLDPLVCPCSTMSRIDPMHLAWILEGLVAGDVRNQITVDDETTRWARVALEQMLATV